MYETKSSLVETVTLRNFQAVSSQNDKIFYTDKMHVYGCDVYIYYNVVEPVI